MTKPVENRVVSAVGTAKITMKSATGVGAVALTDDALKRFTAQEQRRRKGAAVLQTANENKGSKAAIEHNRWCVCANGVWKDHPDLGDSEVARRVIKRLSLNKSVDRVRKIIAKPRG